MKKQYRMILTALLAVSLVGAFALAGCQAPEGTTEEPSQEAPKTEDKDKIELQIFAANSLSKALVEVQELYVAKNPEITFADTQFEGSGTLVESLKAGSYADILITASKGTMDTAVEDKLVDETTRFDMFQNDLVIVTKEDSDIKEATLEDIAEGKYTVAVGDEAVPAGNYAAQALSTVGSYKDPSGETGSKITGKGGEFVGITPALESSVGNVCKKAEAGEVDLAIVYSSDVYRFGGVKVVGTVPADTHKAIVYPVSLCADTEYSEAADAFLQWATTTPEVIKIWQKWGFELL